MPVKRELSVASDSPADTSDRGSPFSPAPSASSAGTSPSPSPKKARTNTTPKKKSGSSLSSSAKTPSPSKGRAGPKARLASEAKRLIAERIIVGGIANLDFDLLERETGLSRQQIKSQIADNRQNLRRQLVDLARSLV